MAWPAEGIRVGFPTINFTPIIIAIEITQLVTIELVIGNPSTLSSTKVYGLGETPQEVVAVAKKSVVKLYFVKAFIPWANEYSRAWKKEEFLDGVPSFVNLLLK